MALEIINCFINVENCNEDLLKHGICISHYLTAGQRGVLLTTYHTDLRDELWIKPDEGKHFIQ